MAVGTACSSTGGGPGNDGGSDASLDGTSSDHATGEGSAGDANSGDGNSSDATGGDDGGSDAACLYAPCTDPQTPCCGDNSVCCGSPIPSDSGTLTCYPGHACPG